MKNKSVMNHQFSNVPNVSVPRSTFDRSHGFKTTFDAGYLVPIYLDEALPGDTFQLNLNVVGRLATPIFPIMDNMFLDTFFFSVPYRLIWNNWQKFCGERTDPADDIDFLIPQIVINNAANESLSDYFGIPTKIAADLNVNSWPYRAYNLIYNEWFRDQNLQDSLIVDKDDGPDSIADYILQRRGKRHDYFTSCLPWTQKGDPILLSLGESAPITGIGKLNSTFNIANASVYETDGTAAKTYLSSVQIGDALVERGFNILQDPNNPGYPDIRVNLSEAIGPAVNELREAFQVQRLLEKDARSGTRYTEILKSHFGVTSDDARLQRPEYLGGGSTPINITPIARTDSSPGKLGALGTVQVRGHGFNKSFTEHCLVLGLACVRADLTYQEGLEKMHTRQTRYDYYWPTLAHLGEQAVLNKEIYVDATTLGNGVSEEVFGYQERFAEYRYKPSKITGKFRSNDAASLDSWHLGIEFGSQPTLDDTFIVENPPIDRVIATPTEPHLIYDSYIQLRTTRPMPIYSIPGFTDHF